MKRERGVSSVVGVLMIVGMTMIAVISILAFGTVAIGDAIVDAHNSQAENSMAQASSKMNMVALGKSPMQGFTIGDIGDGDIEVRPNAGNVSLLFDPVGEAPVELMEPQPFGALVYTNGDTEIAIQGGGVWKREGSWSTMISPPEYHYRDRTLTFPVLRIDGSGYATGSASGAAEQTVAGESLFPNDNQTNPLEDGTVFITIQSDYHRAWYDFFDTRSEGSAIHHPANETVIVDLTTPFEVHFEHAVAATSDAPDAIRTTPWHAPPPDPSETGRYAKSASTIIDNHVDECESGGCQNLSSALASGNVSNGTYYVDDDFTATGAFTIDTTNGDVSFVVDGDLTFTGGAGGPDDEDLTIEGDNDVVFYVRGNFTVAGNYVVNSGGDPSQLLVLVHTNNTEVTFSGTPHLTGVIYAPNSHMVMNGGGSPFNDNIHGAVIGETFDIGPNHDIEYDENAELDFEIDSGSNSITYLHVSENEIDVEIE